MANFRQVHTKIWRDNWFIDLSPEHKLLFIYLFTNDAASISGIYELPMRIIKFDTGLSDSVIEEGLSIFEQAGKVVYGNGVAWVKNLRKYHETASSKVQTKINSDIKLVPDSDVKSRYLIAYGYGIDTLSKEEDRVEIPPYIYTSNSSINSSAATNSALHPLITALAEIAKEHHWTKTESDFDDAALTLFGLDATPEKLREFVAVWNEHGFYSGKPALKTIVTTYKGWIDGVWPASAKPNNNKHGDLQRLTAAITRHGKRGVQAAKAELDGLWATVDRMGGWHALCEMRADDVQYKYYAAVKETAA